MPRDKEKLSVLTELNVGHYELSDLPDETDDLTLFTKNFAIDSGLMPVPLEGELTELSPDIGNLTRLTKLEANKSQYTKLPTEIGNLDRLIELDVSEN